MPIDLKFTPQHVTRNPVEAEVALAIPNNLEPLEVASSQTIAARCDLPKSTVTEAIAIAFQTHVSKNRWPHRFTSADKARKRIGIKLTTVALRGPKTKIFVELIKFGKNLTKINQSVKIM